MHEVNNSVGAVEAVKAYNNGAEESAKAADAAREEYCIVIN